MIFQVALDTNFYRDYSSKIKSSGAFNAFHLFIKQTPAKQGVKNIHCVWWYLDKNKVAEVLTNISVHFNMVIK